MKILAASPVVIVFDGRFFSATLPPDAERDEGWVILNHVPLHDGPPQPPMWISLARLRALLASDEAVILGAGLLEAVHEPARHDAPEGRGVGHRPRTKAVLEPA